MKKNWMTKLAMSFEDAAGGDAGGTGGTGGGATAVADKGASGAGSSVAAGEGGGDAGFSFMRNLTTRDLTPKADVAEKAEGAEAADGQVTDAADKAAEAGGQTEEQKDLENQTEGKTFNVFDDDGKTVLAAFKTREEAEAYVAAHAKKDEAGAAEAAKAANDDAPYAKPIYGRFKDRKETEAGIKRMEQEGLRLAAEVKKTRAEKDQALATRDADLASLRAELEEARKTPPFQELTKEAYDKLAKEDPGAAVDYRLAKRDRDQETQRIKDSAAKQVKDKAARAQHAQAETERVVNDMLAKPEEYPMLDAADAIMGQIHESLGGEDSPLQGDPRAVLVLYDAAMGRMYRELLKKGKAATEDATAHAKKTAAAAAQATGAAGAGAAAKKDAPKNPNAAWEASIDKAGNKRILSFTD